MTATFAQMRDELRLVAIERADHLARLEASPKLKGDPWIVAKKSRLATLRDAVAEFERMGSTEEARHAT